MLGIIVDDLVIDLVRKYDQVVLARQFNDRLKNVLRIQRTRRIVGIDDDNTAGPIRNLFLDILDIGIPVRSLVTEVMHRPAAGQGYRGCPQRVIGCRNQHFITVVEQGLHCHDNQFTDTVAQVNIVDFYVGDIFLLAILHHGLAARIQAPGIAVTLGLWHVMYHVLDDFIRCIETER